MLSPSGPILGTLDSKGLVSNALPDSGSAGTVIAARITGLGPGPHTLRAKVSRVGNAFLDG